MRKVETCSIEHLMKQDRAQNTKIHHATISVANFALFAELSAKTLVAVNTQVESDSRIDLSR
jgi:hypothetical protein